MGSQRLQRYLEVLEDLFGRDVSFVRVRDDLSVLVHHDVPEYGLTTAATWGLSLVHPRELLLQVESRDPAWPLVLGEVAAELRRGPVALPGVLELEEPLAPDTQMTGFFFFRPQALPEGEERIDLPGGAVELVQLYPLHHGEVERVRREGPAFLKAHRGWHPTSVHRRDLSGA